MGSLIRIFQLKKYNTFDLPKGCTKFTKNIWYSYFISDYIIHFIKFLYPFLCGAPFQQPIFLQVPSTAGQSVALKQETKEYTYTYTFTHTYIIQTHIHKHSQHLCTHCHKHRLANTNNTCCSPGTITAGITKGPLVIMGPSTVPLFFHSVTTN